MRAIVLEKNPDFSATSKIIPDYLLTENATQDILIKIHYSAINYKDALAITNSGKIVRSFPFIPGIDFAGIVEQSNSDIFKVGDQVISTGHGVGEKFFGGLCEYAYAKEGWLNRLPENLSMQEAMSAGTAGLTAMLCIDRLLNQGHLTPDDGPIIVSGASGGVGSYAVNILNTLGFEVTAISSKRHEYIEHLGAKKIIHTKEFTEKSKVLDTQKWAGAVDVVGHDVLANMLAQMKYGGTIAACGLAGGYQLNTTVMPFILRGINLLGVDSVYYPNDKRGAIWKKLADIMPQLKKVHINTISLEDVQAYAVEMINGKIKGRAIVALN